MNLVASSPDLLGIGLDEDTAIVVTDETDLEVVGRGSVFCVDMRSALTDAATARGTHPVMISGAAVHFLPHGARFDLSSRTLVSYRDHSAVDPGDLPEPTHDLATISRRVAAEGVDDAVVARNAATTPPRQGAQGVRRERPARADRPTASPDLSDPRDPGLPRAERVVLRAGDPPGRGPRVARGVPDRPAARLHRPAAGLAARGRGALLLARPQGRVRRAAARGHLGWGTSPSTSPCSCRTRSGTTPGGARPAAPASPGSTT